MREVFIIGVGSTDYGVLPYTAVELASQASIEAMRDAGVKAKEIEALYVGACQASYGNTQLHIAPIIATDLGIANIACTRIESACVTGGIAFREAYIAVAGGFYDMVLVAATESVSKMSTPRATEQFAVGGDYLYEARAGVTFPAFFALAAQDHIRRYKTTKVQMAQVAVKNHRNAMSNPHAQFRKEISLDKVMKSFVVAEPLRFLDCCPFSDGAAAAVLVSEKFMERVKKPIKIIGSGQAADYAIFHERESLSTMLSTVRAAEQAHKQAGIKPGDVDFAEVHDCFTIAEIMASEDLGFFKKGEGGPAAEAGETAIGGKIPINPSGGLKAKGHPVGATGVGQIYELVMQLRGEAEGRQVKDAEIGLAHNSGGSGATCTVHILRRV